MTGWNVQRDSRLRAVSGTFHRPALFHTSGFALPRGFAAQADLFGMGQA